MAAIGSKHREFHLLISAAFCGELIGGIQAIRPKNKVFHISEPTFRALSPKKPLSMTGPDKITPHSLTFHR